MGALLTDLQGFDQKQQAIDLGGLKRSVLANSRDAEKCGGDGRWLSVSLPLWPPLSGLLFEATKQACAASIIGCLCFDVLRLSVGLTLGLRLLRSFNIESSLVCLAHKHDANMCYAHSFCVVLLPPFQLTAATH